jgi:NAD(P)-dependent dehydrogenase (short-subunit alcohol dehydrogenase family)
VSLLRGKSALVTGATGGIGYETALGLARLGADIYLHGRNQSMVDLAVGKFKRALPHAAITPIVADFADLAQVRRMASQINAPLDILVNNTGCWTAARRETSDGFEMQFGVNYLSPFLLTELLLPKLYAATSARIVMLSSTMHQRGALDFDDLMLNSGRYNGVNAYANSKLCGLLMMTSLVARLAGSRVLINAVHPGAVATDIARAGGAVGFLLRLGRPFLLSPAQGARTPIFLASDPSVITSGGYYENERLAEMHATARDSALAEKLYRVSAALTAVSV